MRVGVKLPNIGPLATRDGICAITEAAEERGYDSVWVSDHIALPVSMSSQYPYSQAKTPPKASRSGRATAITALAVAAARSEHLFLGTAVTPLPSRNPVVTAADFASLDLLAGGSRVICGVGVGWMKEEFEFLQAPPFKERGRVLEEWIAIMRLLWSGRQDGYDGKYYQFEPLAFAPLPAEPIPIWIGGHSDAALARAGRLGDGWVGTHPTIEEVVSFKEVIADSATAAGRSASSVAIAAGYDVHLGPGTPVCDLHGDADTLRDAFLAMKEVGVDHLLLRFVPQDGKDSLEAVTDQLRHFAHEVLPGLH